MAAASFRRWTGFLSTPPLVLLGFNETVVRGTVSSTSLALCESPPFVQPGYAALEVGVNLQDFSSDGKTFSFDYARLTSLEPRQGPVAGGTMLTISGFDMTHLACVSQRRLAVSNDLHCEFTGVGLYHTHTVPATQLGASSLICMTPSQLDGLRPSFCKLGGSHLG